MSDSAEKLTLADPGDLAAALAFALRFTGRKRVHNADEIVAKPLVKRLERAAFERVANGGGAVLARGFEG